MNCNDCGKELLNGDSAHIFKVRDAEMKGVLVSGTTVTFENGEPVTFTRINRFQHLCNACLGVLRSKAQWGDEDAKERLTKYKRSFEV